MKAWILYVLVNGENYCSLVWADTESLAKLQYKENSYIFQQDLGTINNSGYVDVKVERVKYLDNMERYSEQEIINKLLETALIR